MRRAILAFVTSAVIAPAATAHADASVEVMLNAEGERIASDLGISVDELIQRAKDKITELYRVADLDVLLRGFANTAAFAQRGLAVDFDPDPGDVVLGIGAAGVHGNVAIGTTNALLGGSIINLGVMGGVNLGRWHHPRWTVFANGSYEQTTIHGLDGHLLTLGAHVQNRLVPATHPGAARWTGITATTGVEYGRWTVGEASPIHSHFTAEGENGAKRTVDMSSAGTLSVEATTVTVPLEVTTGARFLGVLGIYAGGGIDLTWGQSTIVAQLDSMLTINKDEIPVGTAVITASGENDADPLTLFWLAGAEIHTPHFRVVLQAASSPGELAVTLGTRGAF